MIIVRIQQDRLDKDEAPKHSPKPNIHKKKLMVTAWYGAAMV